MPESCRFTFGFQGRGIRLYECAEVQSVTYRLRDGTEVGLCTEHAPYARCADAADEKDEREAED